MAFTTQGLPNQVVGAEYQSCVGDLPPVLADISSADYVPTFNSRAISSVGGTVIKVDVTTPAGVTSGVIIPSGGFVPFINISKVYKTGTDAASIYLYPRA